MLKVDEIDRKIINLLKRNAHVSSHDMSEQLEISASTIRRRIKALTANKMIRKQAIQINHVRSSIQVTVMLKVENTTINEVSELLANQPEAILVLLFNGHFNIMAFCWFESVEAYSNFSNTILYTLQHVQEIETLICSEYRKYAFAKLPNASDSIKAAEAKVDDMDLKIISLLEKDASLNNANIAKLLHISAASVRRRVNYLLSNNIIRIQAFPNMRAGKSIAAMIVLKVENDAINTIADHFADIDEVRTVMLYIGDYDIAIWGWFDSIDVFSKFLNDAVNPLHGVESKMICIQTEIKKWVHKW